MAHEKPNNTAPPTLRGPLFCGTDLFPLFLALVALNFVLVATPSFTTLTLVLRPLPALILAVGVCERNWLFALGLLMGSAGDEILAIGVFVPGLLCFLVGHLFYTCAFLLESTHLGLSSAFPAAAYAASLLAIVAPTAGALVGPISVYGTVLCVMAWRACVHEGPRGGFNTRATGAWLFVLSDSLIAVDTFVGPFAGSETAIFITYYAAQCLLAMSAPERAAAETSGAGVDREQALTKRARQLLGGGCTWHLRVLGLPH